MILYLFNVDLKATSCYSNLLSLMNIKHTEKKNIIKRLLIEPSFQKRSFWSREMKFLNELYKKFPDLSFWELISFEKKYDSLLFLKGEYGLNLLKKKFLEFSYKIPEKAKPVIGEKTGYDYTKPKKPKTIRQFLINE